MVREIVRNETFLSQPCVAAEKEDLWIGEDLRDTLLAHQEECLGLAANMIGIQKRVIIADAGFLKLIMYNPVVIQKSGPYSAQEACLSLVGARPALRYKNVKITFRDSKWEERTAEYSGQLAQIIQHELDHLDGILI